MQHAPARSPRLSRRALLGATAGVGLGLPAVVATDALVVTPGWLSTTAIDMATASGQAALAAVGTPPAAKLAQLSDLHLKQIGRLEEQLLDTLNADPPDLLLFTGDAFDAARGIDVFAEFLAACPRRSQAIGILGNWEYRSGISTERIARVYEHHDGRLLVNESIMIDTAAGSLRVSGLDDLVGGKPRPEIAEPAGRQEPHVLLAHCPGQRDRLGDSAHEQIDLMLAGHTHGGQVAPFGMALITPGGSGRYVRGWYRDQGPPMYVSRGLGNSTLPIRLGVTPELVTIRWSLS